MNNQGWIKLHRKIEDNPLWLLEPFTKGQAWIDLILNANHKDSVINIRGNIVPIKRGQLGWSELTMAKRWRWSKNKVRRFLSYLSSKTIQQIIQQKYRYITTIITIIKYEEYQQTEQQTIQQKDSRRYINKNDKNVKNILSKDNMVKKLPNSEIEFILSSYKKYLGHIPTDNKPRQMAQNIRQITHTFIKNISPYKKYEFNEVITKAYEWYMKRDQLKGETLRVFKNKIKMLYDLTLDKAKGGDKYDKQI